MDVSKQWYKTSLWSVFRIFLNIFKQLILVKFFIRNLNADNYSIWLIVISLTFLLSSGLLGFYQFGGNKLNFLYHKDELVFSLYLKKFFNFSVYLILLVFIFWILIFQVEAVLTYSKIEEAVLTAFLVYFLSHLIFQLSFRFVIRIYEPIGQMKIKAQTEVITEIIELLLLTVFILTIKNINVIIILMALIKITASLWVILQLKSKLFKLHDYFSFQEYFVFGQNEVKKSLFHIYSNISEKALNEGLLFFINISFATSILINFSIYRAIYNLPMISIMLLIGVFTPEIQRLYSLNKTRHLTDYIEALYFINTAIMFISFLILNNFSNYIFTIISDNAVLASSKLSNTISFYIFSCCFTAQSLQIIRALNKKNLVIIISSVKLFFLSSILFFPESPNYLFLILGVSELLISSAIHIVYLNNLRKIRGLLPLLMMSLNLFVPITYLSNYYFQNSVGFTILQVSIISWIIYKNWMFLPKTSKDLIFRKGKELRV